MIISQVEYDAEIDFSEHPDEDLCMGRAMCMDANEAKRVGAVLHTSYKIYGWVHAKGFIYHSVQCDSKPAPGENLCKTCIKRLARYEASGSSNKSKWHGYYGYDIPVDSHARWGVWSNNVMSGITPPKSK
jgi:hypothetical protein